MAALVAGQSPAPLQDDCSPEEVSDTPASSPQSERRGLKPHVEAHPHEQPQQPQQGLEEGAAVNKPAVSEHHINGGAGEYEGAGVCVMQAFEEEHGARSPYGLGVSSWRASPMVSGHSHSMDVTLDGIPPEIRPFLTADPSTLTVPSELLAHLHDADASMGFRAFSPAASEFAHAGPFSPGFGHSRPDQHNGQPHAQEINRQQEPHVEDVRAADDGCCGGVGRAGSADDDAEDQGESAHDAPAPHREAAEQEQHQQERRHEGQHDHHHAQQRQQRRHAAVPTSCSARAPTLLQDMPHAVTYPGMMRLVSTGQQPMLPSHAEPGTQSIPVMSVVSHGGTLLLHNQMGAGLAPGMCVHAGPTHNASSPTTSTATSTCSSLGEDAAVQPTTSAAPAQVPAQASLSFLASAGQTGVSIIGGSNSSSNTAKRMALVSGAPTPAQRRRRRNIPRFVQPQRNEFDSDEAYVAAMQRWKAYREKNNASVRKSRERARERDLMCRRVLRDIERRRQQLVSTVSTLRSNLHLLLRSFFDAESLSPLEAAWVQTLVRSKDGLQLATEATLTS